jgi:hypothetical protein
MMRFAVVALAVLMLSACATVERFDAAGDVHAFLIAIRDGDHAAFEAHVDRHALKDQLRARVMAAMLKRQDAVGALGAALAGPLVDVAVDQLVQPTVFLAIAEANGYAPSRPIPGRAALAGALRQIDPDRVCLTVKRGGDCVLDFRDEGGTWRLTAFEGDLSLLRGQGAKLR